MRTWGGRRLQRRLMWWGRREPFFYYGSFQSQVASLIGSSAGAVGAGLIVSFGLFVTMAVIAFVVGLAVNTVVVTTLVVCMGVGAPFTLAGVCWVVWGPGVAVVPVQPHIAIKIQRAMIRIAHWTGNLASLNKITSFLLIKEFKNVYLRIYDL